MVVYVKELEKSKNIEEFCSPDFVIDPEFHASLKDTY